MAAELAAEGETLLDELGRIAHRYGLYQSAQRSLAFAGAEGPAKMAALMDAIRADPPNDIGGSPVLVFTDCDASTRRARGEPPTPIDLPKSDVLIFELEGGHRVIARPSGTEPKMKIYFDVCKPLAADESLAVGRARAAARIERIGEDFCRRLA
jgi:phosphomannomutase